MLDGLNSRWSHGQSGQTNIVGYEYHLEAQEHQARSSPGAVCNTLSIVPRIYGLCIEAGVALLYTTDSSTTIVGTPCMLLV